MPDPNDGMREHKSDFSSGDPDRTVVVPQTPGPPGGDATVGSDRARDQAHGDDETEVVSRDRLGLGSNAGAGGPATNQQRPSQVSPQPSSWGSQTPSWSAPTAPPQGPPAQPGGAAFPPPPTAAPQQNAAGAGAGAAYPPPPPAGYGPPAAGYPPAPSSPEPPRYGPPSAPMGYGQPPGPGDAFGAAGHSAQPNMPPPPRDYAADARAALNKGNSFLGRLLRKGVNGELIPVAAFQSYRMHKPVPLTVAVFIIGLILAGLFGQSGGLIGLILSEAVWALTAFVLIAIGTKGALQTIVYGICLVGALGFAAAAYIAFTSYSTLSSLPYSGGISISLLVIGVAAIVLAIVHGYIGLQVNREIKKIASGQ